MTLGLKNCAYLWVNQCRRYGGECASSRAAATSGASPSSINHYVARLRQATLPLFVASAKSTL